ncbi:MAG TPA: DUF983 domain-containing protein [Hyphomicrobiaceae bacterium]|nr:DUF983 domain-containing protein [Hyphomicrobiaceae bacterium]
MTEGEPITTVSKGAAVAAGLRCRCPRCGEGLLFAGAFNLDLREACERCGMSYKFIDSGDGPAVFAIMILGFLMLGGALLLEFSLHPPVWVHMAIWGPVTLLLAFGLLRPLKALLIALQFANKAQEGRRAGD